MAKIFGQLEKAQLENTTSDTGSLPKGTATYRTDLNLPKVSNGTVMKTLVDTDTAQTLSNKTLDNTTVLQSPSVTGALTLQEIATPTTPSSGNGKIYFKSDGKLYQLNDDGTETQVGSGSGGGVINYMSANPDAESNTTGYVTYADAAASRPVDGTGGSPTITWTRTTSTPLRGTASFLFTKDAANRQGEGVAYDFTINEADKAKVLQISFDYQIASGTYSGGTSSTDSDLIVYVYRTTATGRLIEPSIIKLDGGVSGVNYSYRGEFQTDSDATGYRLIVHVATTSTSAYTVEFDNFVIGPSKNISGDITTEWISYTPTITNFGSVSSVAFEYRRNGDSIDVRGKFVSGTPAAAEAQIGLPAGLTAASTNKIPSIKVAGLIGFSTNLNNTHLLMIEPSVTYFTVGLQAVASGVFAKRNASALVAGGDTISIAASGIPISGFGATATLGQDADTRVISARARLTTAQTGVTSKVVPFNSITKDTSGSLNTSTGIYTVPVAGQYRVSAGILVGSLDGTTDARLQIRKNSTIVTDAYCTRLTGGSTTSGSGYVSDILDCVAGDTIDIFIQGDASFDIDNNGNRTFVAIDRLAGPSQIAATEYIGLSVNTTSTAIGSALATIVFTNRVLDTHNAYNTSTGIWTCPATGNYCVEGAIFVTGTFGSDVRVNCMIRINGVDTVAALFRTGFNPTGGAGSGIATTTRRILAGQQVELRGATQATGAAYSSDTTLTYLNITKVGL